MSDPFPEDILQRIASDFSGEAPFVVEVLTNYHEYLCATYQGADACNYRLIRCILRSANGNFAGLQHALDQAIKDYRDLIVAGEYDGELNRIRDLSKPFDAE